MSWKIEDLKFSFRADMSEGDVVAAVVETPVGPLEVIANWNYAGGR